MTKSKERGFDFDSFVETVLISHLSSSDKVKEALFKLEEGEVAAIKKEQGLINDDLDVMEDRLNDNQDDIESLHTEVDNLYLLNERVEIIEDKYAPQTDVDDLFADVKKLNDFVEKYKPIWI